LPSREAEHLSLCDRIAPHWGKVIKVRSAKEISGDASLLREHDLEVPPLVDLFSSLGLEIPKNIEEAKRKLKKVLI